jgi:membrane protein DedA with SNARE-associated domain
MLFLEEAGLPIPVAPGEVMLIGAGLLVASGAAPIWVIGPLAYLAVIGGVVTGYSWAHWIGPKRLHAFAERLHAAGPFDRAAARLRSASPLQIAASRLLPGLRVYTSLVAGAVGLKIGRFMAGVVPASALWVAVFMGLGIFVGAPVERLLGRFEAYGLQALVVVGVVIVWVVAARSMPSAKPAAASDPRRARWRFALAAGLDLVALACVAAVLSLVTGVARGDFDDETFLAVMFAVLGVLYLVVARETVGYTLGEALLDVRYHPPHRPTFGRQSKDASS